MKQFRYVGRLVFALAFITFGVSHFSMVEHFSSMVPGFFPFPDFWIYFVGVAYILAALSILFNIVTPLACISLGILMFIIALAVHLPQIPDSGQQMASHWFSFVQAVGVGSAAWYMGGVFATNRTKDEI